MSPSNPRYFHAETSVVVEITGHTIQHRNRAKAKAKRLVKAAGGDPEEVEYRAGMAPGLQRVQKATP